MIMSSLLASLAQRITAYRNYRLTLRAFSALDDHELSDLGIYRGRIDEIARGSVR